MKFSRRELIVGSGVFAVAHGCPAFAQTLPPVRGRTFGEVAPSSIGSYKRAVDAMLKLDASDGRNWFRQTLIHIFDCPHGNWWFLPWHRGYLINFESICRELSGDDGFRLPYWDWTESPSIPSVFFDAELDPGDPRFTEGYARFREGAKAIIDDLFKVHSSEQKAELTKHGIEASSDVLDAMDYHFSMGNGSRSPKADARDLSPRTKAAVASEKIKTIINEPTFLRFASGKTVNHQTQGVHGGLESQPHDNVHGGTGGFMGAFLSPVDPLFWLHHANLDRLWHIWTLKQKRSGLPYLPDGSDMGTFGDEPFLFFHGRDGTGLVQRCADCLDLEALGYSYENGSAQELSDQSPQVVSFTGTQQFTALSVNKALRSGFETSMAITGLSKPLAVAAKEEGPELYARITLTPPKELKDTSLRVYINCPYLSQYTPVEDPHYAGSIDFFSARHLQAHHDSEFTVIVPLGVALRALDQQGKIPQSAIKVQLITDTTSGAEITDGLLKSVVIEAV